MANAIVTFKIMPLNPEIDLESIKNQATAIIKEAGAKGDLAHEMKPLAFGLKELDVLAMFEVKDGNDFDAIVEKINALEGVQSAEIAKMDLAMG